MKKISNAGNSYFKSLQDARFHYEAIKEKILEISALDPRRWFDPYTHKVDWNTIMTPIEFSMWSAIRFYGKAPMYPQYPVANFFLDFGNPALKIGIECDGAEYHEDKEKDMARDNQLEELGWTIFRISGPDCHRQIELYDRAYSGLSEHIQNNLSEDFILNTADGLIKAIGIVYLNCPVFADKHSEYKLSAKCLLARATTNKETVFEMGRLAIERGEKIKMEALGYAD